MAMMLYWVLLCMILISSTYGGRSPSKQSPTFGSQRGDSRKSSRKLDNPDVRVKNTMGQWIPSPSKAKDATSWSSPFFYICVIGSFVLIFWMVNGLDKFHSMANQHQLSFDLIVTKDEELNSKSSKSKSNKVQSGKKAPLGYVADGNVPLRSWMDPPQEESVRSAADAAGSCCWCFNF